ncbi:MAG TPA: hypothetical protein VFZ53_30070 [Polyangiaceae bacterium]
MSETALAARPPDAINAWRDPDWQRLWLSLRNRPWQSLAVVPAGPGAPLDFAVRIAVMLSRTGMLHLGSPIQVADATRLPLGHLAAFLKEVERCARDGDPVVVALAALSDNPVSLALAQATDAAVLCVALEHMQYTDASKAVSQVGASRFIGSVVIDPSGLAALPGAI